MQKTNDLILDETLLLLIKEHYNKTKKPIIAGAKNFVLALSQKNIETNVLQVEKSLKRLISNNKIERKWNGKQFETIPLEEMIAKKEFVSGFIFENPVSPQPVVFEIYKYLKDNAVGVRNAVSMSFLASWHKVSERKIREIVERINFDGYILEKKDDNGDTIKDGTFMRLIMGDNNGYYLVSNSSELDSINNRYDRDLYVASKKRKIIRRKSGLDNQTKITIGEFERSYEKTVSNDLNKKN